MFAVFATPGRPFGRTLRARVPAPLATVTTTPPPLRVFAEVVEHRVTFDIVFFRHALVSQSPPLPLIMPGNTCDHDGCAVAVYKSDRHAPWQNGDDVFCPSHCNKDDCDLPGHKAFRTAVAAARAPAGDDDDRAAAGPQPCTAKGSSPADCKPEFSDDRACCLEHCANPDCVVAGHVAALAKRLMARDSSSSDAPATTCAASGCRNIIAQASVCLHCPDHCSNSQCTIFAHVSARRERDSTDLSDCPGTGRGGCAQPTGACGSCIDHCNADSCSESSHLTSQLFRQCLTLAWRVQGTLPG